MKNVNHESIKTEVFLDLEDYIEKAELKQMDFIGTVIQIDNVEEKLIILKAINDSLMESYLSVAKYCFRKGMETASLINQQNKEEITND